MLSTCRLSGSTVCACLAVTTLVATAGCGSGGEADSPPSGSSPEECAAGAWGSVDPALAARLQAALEAARAEQDLPGLAMAVAYRDSRQLWVSATGFADREAQTPWRSCDESRIGSVTKTFTTAIVMQLAEAGVLSLDDRVEAWVPGWYSGPTLRHLLAHSSGIASYDGVGQFDFSRAWTPRELVQWAYDHEPTLRFAPGTGWDYSNTNFVLLGMVIERATGRSYGDALQTRLFEPLGLEMRLALAGDDSPRLVSSYWETSPANHSYDPSYGWAAGGIVSTPADLAAWIVALYGGELLPAAALAAMTTPSGLTPLNVEQYGLGTVIQGDGEEVLVGHGGGLGGYQTFAYYLESEAVGLIVMSNRAPTDMYAASAHGFAAVLGIPYRGRE